jgi:hypothetical protein
MRVLELRYYLGAEASDGTDAERKELVQKRVASEGSAAARNTMLAGDVDTGKAILRD